MLARDWLIYYPEDTGLFRVSLGIFETFSSIRMSSCRCWKAAKSDAQTTAHVHPGRTYENIARPMQRLAASPDEIPFPEGMPRMHRHRTRKKSSAPNGRRDCPALS